MITRVAVYIALGLVLAGLGIQWDQSEFWCILGLFWGVEFLARMEGRQQGVAQVLDMPTWQYARLKAVMEKISRQEEVTVEQIQEILKQGQDNERK
jgi:hypothetical protein